jgi:hypothetical protein
MLEKTMLPPLSTLKIEAAQPFETPVPMYHINLHHVLKSNTNMNILVHKKIATKVLNRRVNSWRVLESVSSQTNAEGQLSFQ